MGGSLEAPSSPRTVSPQATPQHLTQPLWLLGCVGPAPSPRPQQTRSLRLAPEPLAAERLCPWLSRLAGCDLAGALRVREVVTGVWGLPSLLCVSFHLVCPGMGSSLLGLGPALGLSLLVYGGLLQPANQGRQINQGRRWGWGLHGRFWKGLVTVCTEPAVLGGRVWQDSEPGEHGRGLWSLSQPLGWCS